MNRRRFLALTCAVVAVPTFIPASALGRGGAVAPSNRITMGVVGWGMQGPANTRAFLSHADCQVVGTCNIDQNHLQASRDTINAHCGNQDCETYDDYRELMARRDIDAVMLAVPDHWHALIGVEAALNKKDICGEKPLARTIAEQQAIVRAVQKNKRVWQTGSLQRSETTFRYAAEIVRNGLIGKLKRVEVGLYGDHHDKVGNKEASIQKLAVLPGQPAASRRLFRAHPHGILP